MSKRLLVKNKYTEDEIPLILHAKEFLIENAGGDIRIHKDTPKNEIGDNEK